MVEIKRLYSVLLAGQPVAVHRYCDPYQKVCTGNAIVCGLVARTSVQLPSAGQPRRCKCHAYVPLSPPLDRWCLVFLLCGYWLLVWKPTIATHRYTNRWQPHSWPHFPILHSGQWVAFCCSFQLHHAPDHASEMGPPWLAVRMPCINESLCILVESPLASMPGHLHFHVCGRYWSPSSRRGSCIAVI